MGRKLLGELVVCCADLDMDTWLNQQLMQFKSYHDSHDLPSIPSDSDEDGRGTPYEPWTRESQLLPALEAQEGVDADHVWGPAQGVAVCRPTGDTYPILTPPRPPGGPAVVPPNEPGIRKLRPRTNFRQGPSHQRREPTVSTQRAYLRRKPRRPLQNKTTHATRSGESTSHKLQLPPGNTNNFTTAKMRQKATVESYERWYPQVTIEFGDPHLYPSNPSRINSHDARSILGPDIGEKIEFWSKTAWSKIPSFLDDQRFELDPQMNDGLVAMIDASSSAATILDVANVINGKLEHQEDLKRLMEVFRYCVLSVAKWVEGDTSLPPLVNLVEVICFPATVGVV